MVAPAECFIVFGTVACGVLMVLCGLGDLIIASLIVTSLNAYSNPLTEMMFIVLRAELIALFVFGAFGIVLGIIAMLPSCIISRRLFITILVLSAMYLMTQLILLIVWAAIKSTLYGYAASSWLTNLQSNFDDVPDQVISTATTYPGYWNNMTFTLKCCGINSYTDYQSATNWQKSYTYYSNGAYVTVTPTMPVWCCQQNPTQFALRNPTTWNCVTSPTSSNSYYLTGCEQALLDAVNQPEYDAAGLAMTIILILLAFCMMVAAAIAIRNELYDIRWLIGCDRNYMWDRDVQRRVEPRKQMPPPEPERRVVRREVLLPTQQDGSVQPVVLYVNPNDNNANNYNNNNVYNPPLPQNSQTSGYPQPVNTSQNGPVTQSYAYSTTYDPTMPYNYYRPT